MKITKIKKLAALFLLCVICLTGCMRYNVTITVKPNGKMDVSMLMAMMKMEGLGETSQGLSDEDKQKFLDEGWEVEEYNKDNYYGFLMSKKDITPNEVADSVDSSQDSMQGSSSGFQFTKEGLKYVIDWKMNNGTSSDSGQATDISAYANYFKMYDGYVTLTINLPVKPLNSNATSVSNNGKSLEWDILAMGNDSSIHLEFMLINIWLIVLIILIVLVVIALTVVVIVLLVKKAKKSKIPVVHMQPVDSSAMSWGGMITDMNAPVESTAANDASRAPAGDSAPTEASAESASNTDNTGIN